MRTLAQVKGQWNRLLSNQTVSILLVVTLWHILFAPFRRKNSSQKYGGCAGPNARLFDQFRWSMVPVTWFDLAKRLPCLRWICRNDFCVWYPSWTGPQIGFALFYPGEKVTIVLLHHWQWCCEFDAFRAWLRWSDTWLLMTNMEDRICTIEPSDKIVTWLKLKLIFVPHAILNSPPCVRNRLWELKCSLVIQSISIRMKGFYLSFNPINAVSMRVEWVTDLESFDNGNEHTKRRWMSGIWLCQIDTSMPTVDGDGFD